MWTEAVAALPGTTLFQPPVSEPALLRCATVLGHALPTDLTALLRESDGIEDEYGDGLIWSAEQITAENRNLRGDAAFSTLYMPFDPLLFFADAGTETCSRSWPGSTGPMSSSGTTRTTAAPGWHRGWPPTSNGG